MKRLCYILLLFTCTLPLQAKVHVPDSVMHRDGLYVDNLKIYPDSAIFQGATLKLNLFNTVYYLAYSKGQLQTYDFALNFRLKNRFYPTLEMGYTQGSLSVNDATWTGKGGFTSLGLDINGLRKHRNELDALLVGIRVAGAGQHYDLKNVRVDDDYWQDCPTIDLTDRWRLDCWGEILAGCQVHVYSGLMMGWDIRLKVLFTRNVPSGAPRPYFVPGYGYWNYTQWGINYYIGWKF